MSKERDPNDNPTPIDSAIEYGILSIAEYYKRHPSRHVAIYGPNDDDIGMDSTGTDKGMEGLPGVHSASCSTDRPGMPTTGNDDTPDYSTDGPDRRRYFYRSGHFDGFKEGYIAGYNDAMAETVRVSHEAIARNRARFDNWD